MGKARDEKRRDQVLFLDARAVFRQVTRAVRDFTDEQVEYLANIVRLYRVEKPELDAGSKALLKDVFPKMRYADVAGLCKVATLEEIEAQGWSLNPGRYVGVGERAADEFDFEERLRELNEEFEVLAGEARTLELRIAENIAGIITHQ